MDDKLRVLVTHQVQYLENADNILVLDNGAIISEGTYSQLSKSDTFFSKFITNQEKNNDNRTLPSTSSEHHQSSELWHRLDDEGVERAVEDKATGAVSITVYWQYFKAGTCFIVYLSSIFNVITNIIFIIMS